MSVSKSNWPLMSLVRVVSVSCHVPAAIMCFLLLDEFESPWPRPVPRHDELDHGATGGRRNIGRVKVGGWCVGRDFVVEELAGQLAEDVGVVGVAEHELLAVEVNDGAAVGVRDNDVADDTGAVGAAGRAGTFGAHPLKVGNVPGSARQNPLVETAVIGRVGGGHYPSRAARGAAETRDDVVLIPERLARP